MPESGARGFAGVSFDKSVSIGNILTFLSVMFSVVALWSSWSHDRDLKLREEATKIRTSVAVTIAKLDRWKQLSLSYFRQAEPLYVKVSAQSGQQFHAIAARDFLYENLQAIRAPVLERLLSENIETAYVDLYAYDHTLRAHIDATLRQLRDQHAIAADNLLLATQTVVLSFPAKRSPDSSDSMGSELRRVAAEIERSYTKQIDEIEAGVLDKLDKLAEQSDTALLAGRH
jgi:hypothetical protein